MGCTVSSVKVGCAAESGAVAKNRANCAINVGSVKSRVQTRRYARLAMYGNYNRYGVEPVIRGTLHRLARLTNCGAANENRTGRSACATTSKAFASGRHASRL